MLNRFLVRRLQKWICCFQGGCGIPARPLEEELLVMVSSWIPVNTIAETLSDQGDRTAHCCNFFSLEEVRKAPAERRETDMWLKSASPCWGLRRSKKQLDWCQGLKVWDTGLHWTQGRVPRRDRGKAGHTTAPAKKWKRGTLKWGPAPAFRARPLYNTQH